MNLASSNTRELQLRNFFRTAQPFAFLLMIYAGMFLTLFFVYVTIYHNFVMFYMYNPDILISQYAVYADIIYGFMFLLLLFSEYRASKRIPKFNDPRITKNLKVCFGILILGSFILAMIYLFSALIVEDGILHSDALIQVRPYISPLTFILTILGPTTNQYVGYFGFLLFGVSFIYFAIIFRGLHKQYTTLVPRRTWMFLALGGVLTLIPLLTFLGFFISGFTISR